MLRHGPVLGLAVLIAALAFPGSAQAKDNTNHVLALGFQADPIQPATPALLLSAKFAAAPNAEFAALIGFTLDNGFFSLSFGGKALLILVPEQHLNFYLTAMVLPTVGTYGLHDFAYFVGPGIAYYPPGSENLEIFTEFGLGGAARFGNGAQNPALPNPPLLSTTGSITLGLHYWF